MSRKQVQALIRIFGPEAETPRRLAAGWIGFVLGMIVMFFVMGVVPYRRLIVQIWNSCIA